MTQAGPVTNPGMWAQFTDAVSNAYQALPATATVVKSASSLTNKVIEFARPFFSQISNFVESHQTEVLTALVVTVAAVAAYKTANTIYRKICCCC